MDFKKLRTFRATARLLNFSAAANQLGYVQSAVTTQIKALEEELSISLFDRNARGVSLTPAGSMLLDYADQLFSLRDEAKSAISGVQNQHNTLKIAGYETILTYRLPKIIHAFKQVQPKTHLTIQPMNVRLLKSQVNNGDIDIAFLLEKETEATGLNQLPLPVEEVVIITPNDHPLSKRKKVTSRDLGGETLLLTEQGCNYRNKFEQSLIKSGSYTGDTIEFVSIEAIKSCVKMGTGIAAVSKVSVEKELQQGEISSLDWAGDDLSVGVTAVWKKSKAEREVISSFLKLCQE